MTSVAAPVQLTGPDRGSKPASSLKPRPASAARGLRVTVVEQFALDGAQHVGGHPGVEVDLSAGRLAHIAFDEFGHRRHQLGRRRSAV